MGFSNGYDSGYADAIDDVRAGKVAGLGPASGNDDGTRPAVPFSLRPNVMYIKSSPGTGEVKGTVDSTNGYPALVVKVDPDDILSVLSDGEVAVLALDAINNNFPAGDINTFYIDGYTQKMVADETDMGPVADGEDPGGGCVLMSAGTELPAVFVAKVGSGLIVKALDRALFNE